MPVTVRRACIDIGSNTTRLLVAETAPGRLLEVHQERAFTRIGAELHTGESIGAAKIAEVAQVVCGQLEQARRMGVEEVHAVATAAIRRARNGEALAAAIRAACGVEVRVLSGDEEARLAFAGARGTLGHAPAGLLGVVDVGGGSSEIVVGEADDPQPLFAVSLPFGSGDVADACLAGDPPSAVELAAARQAVESGLGDVTVPHPAEAVAVGGSATSLRRLGGALLDEPAFERALALLAAAPAAEVSRRFALDRERVRLLPAGLLILCGIARRLAAPLQVGLGGVREGVLLEAAG